MKKIEELLNSGKGNIYRRVVDHAEKDLIEAAIKRTFGNRSLAARLLGINRNTLACKIKKFGIDTDRYKI